MADHMDPSSSENDDYDPPKQSVLCKRCSVLRFDDTAEGFKFRNGRLTFTENSTWAGSQDYAYSLMLDYNFCDQLPRLDGLRTSAQAGCAFCGALREAVLKTCLNMSGRVNFKLCYLWKSRYVKYTLLDSLHVHLEFELKRDDCAHEIIFRVGFERYSRYP